MKLETFFKHFDLLAEAPNGVQKLRELILDLAVRGKLVPQDANDEPAAVLLEKIKKEKERLVKEGKVKKDKLSQSIIAEEIPYKLPTNWQWTKLCEIGLINPRNEVDDSKIASFIPMNLIPQYYNKEIRYEVRKWADIKKGFTHFADGDVVLAKITPCFQNRKSTVIYGLKNSVGAGTTELHVYRPINNLINPEYVLLYLKSAEFINNGISKLTGTAGQKRVPNEYFAENPFPLPPLNEQKRIVTKVDELMKLCDELEARQKKKQETRILINNAALNKLLTADTPETFTKNWQRISDNFDILYSAPENIGKLRQAQKC
jgi:type I restriction enzyme S subunit